MRTRPKLYPARLAALAAAFTLSLTAAAYGAGQHSGGHGHAYDIGKPGTPAQATRTVTVVTIDNRFTPEHVSVTKGETVRFVVRNEGQLVHEFNIGTAAMHARHRKEMAMMVEHGVLEADRINWGRMKMDMGGGRTMEHDDPNSLLLEPGKSGEIVWTFSTDAHLEFACNIPGHYEAGMTGDISIEK